MSNEIDALDVELTRLLYGASQAADAPAASELMPLVQAAARLHQLAGIQLSAAARSRMRAAIQADARLRPRAEERAFAWRPRMAGRPAMAAAFAVALLALGTTSVFASSGALPDSPLYPERNLGEGLQLRLAQTAQERAALNVRFAAARVSQLHGRLQKHATLTTDAMTVLLADIRNQVKAATREARTADQGTRDQIQQQEGQIKQQLNQIQHDGDLPANQGQSIGETVKSLQADQDNGQSGDNGQSNN